MSKLNIFGIVYAHFASFLDGSIWQKAKDICIFILIPIIFSYLFWAYKGNLSPELRNLFVTVFSIFSALLFSAQIGLFALRRPKTEKNLGDIEENLRKNQDDEFNRFLKEFSANTSYLILISTFALFLFVIEFIVDPDGNASNYTLLLDAAIIFISFHFFLTLLMVLKRFFVAYEASY